MAEMPERLTKQRRTEIVELQRGIALPVLNGEALDCERAQLVYLALRELLREVGAAHDDAVTASIAGQQAEVIADHLAEVARRVTDELDDLAAQNAKTESNFEEFAEAVAADRQRAEGVHAEEVAAMREELTAVREALEKVTAERDEAQREWNAYQQANTRMQQINVWRTNERDRLAEQMAVVEEFAAERARYITSINNCHPDNSHDYWRWQGHAEGRRQLSEQLGLPVAWPAGYVEAADRRRADAIEPAGEVDQP